MNRFRVLIPLIVVLLLAGLAFGQTPYRETHDPSPKEYISRPVDLGSVFYGILDPSRIAMSHQMGMTYASFGGEGFTQGYYLNTMTYRFDAPVLFRLRLGVANDPFATGSNALPGQSALTNLFNEAQFFGGADLDWR
ncbi:MAG TPA: hypothetical protein ENI92_06870, partial [Bacteroidetes bacterium]|nr:hypothetical protein [Bacteroidota bacterium]